MKMEDNKVYCYLCQQEVGKITAAHLKFKHQSTTKEYKKLFPGMPFSSVTTRQKFSVSRMGHIVSEKTRKQIGEQSARLMSDPEYRKQIGQATKKGMDKPEIKQKMREAKLGKTLSSVHKKKIQKKAVELANTPERKEKTRQQALKQVQDQNCNFGGPWPIGESYAEKCYRERLEFLGYVKNQDFFQEHQVDTYRIDFAFPAKMIAFELDGAQHLKPEAIIHDQKRDAWLKEKGWTVMRLTAKKLKQLVEK